jgi:hypothetical protein
MRKEDSVKKDSKRIVEKHTFQDTDLR